MSRRRPDLPHSEECERAVLAAAMMDGEALEEIVAKLTEDDFWRVQSREVFASMRALATAGTPVDLRTLQADLEARQKLDLVGGLPELVALDTDLPDVSRLPHYVAILRDRTARRKVIEFSRELARAARDEGEPAVGLLSRAAVTLERIEAAAADSVERMLPADYGLDESIAMLDRTPGEAQGMTTTLASLDEMTQGFGPGQVWIAAGRPGNGKSAYGLQVAAKNVGAIGAPAAVFSLEMTRLEMCQRWLASHTGISLTRIRGNFVSPVEREILRDAARCLRGVPMWIEDSGKVTAFELGVMARRLKAQKGLELIVVDYLQLVRPNEKAGSREQEVSEISRSLKRLAMELQVPVLALAQLNRASEERTEPKLRDLRESGAIEQDADGVIFLHRTSAPSPAGDVDLEVIVAKNRNGPTGRAKCVFHGATMVFREVTQ